MRQFLAPIHTWLFDKILLMERIEKEILEKQKDLITAKTEQIHSQKRIEELYADALNAMRRYSGSVATEQDYDEDN